MNTLPVMDTKLSAIVAQASTTIDGFNPSWIDIPTLLPADALLDLYGEDIRNRAYIVHDPIEGDMVLRPDFTLPVVQSHFAGGARNGRYAYSGRVWRKRRETDRSDRSFWQLGFERFDHKATPQADAEIFALSSALASGHDLNVTMGDLGLIFSALDHIEMAEYRRRALKRHVWRPRAFERLLEQYQTPLSEKTTRDISIDAPVIGLRDREMIEARIERLNEEAQSEPLPSDAAELIDAILGIDGSLASAVATLETIAKRFGLGNAMAAQLQARADALSDSGFDPTKLAFNAGYGRTSMEYYDGMVFGWFRDNVPAPVISGGRYDGLTTIAGGTSTAAVGVAFRPELVVTV